MLHRNIATSNGCDQAVHFTRLHDQVKRRGPLSTSSLPIPVHQAAYGLALGFRNGVGIVARTPSDTYDSAFYFCYQSHLGPAVPAYGTLSPPCPVIEVAPWPLTTLA